ncbi:MAG: hypothetical protein HYV08_00500, partial [Deltaproteobacteria bacterium]|nr:hypothetical protein [Deltaproteobacteria bacterium]
MDLRAGFRTKFLTGLLVITPVAITAFVLIFLFRTMDRILGAPLDALLGLHVP